MGMVRDTKVPCLYSRSSYSTRFIPLNSPEGEKIEELNATITMQQAMEHDNQPESPIKREFEEDEEMNENTTTPSKGLSSNSNKLTTATTTITTTPSKRKQAPGASATARAGPAASTPTKTPTKRTKKTTEETADETDTAAGTPTRATLPPIPTSLAAAGEADRMILRLRDENKPWSEINKVFQAATGIKVGQTTLRMRYTTMKAHFTGIAREDEIRLLRLKKEIEDKFENEKWHRIVEAIVADGGGKYPAAALQKKFKELSKGQSQAQTVDSTPAADNDED